MSSYTAQDIRFTTTGPPLYASALGWPADGKLLVRSLATPADKVSAVSLIGYDGAVPWQQTPEGLLVNVPTKKVSEYTCALRIAGTDLKPVPFLEVSIIVPPDAEGHFVLKPDDANLQGDQLKVEAQGGEPNIGFWDKAEESVSWKVNVDKPGTFTVSVSCATPPADAQLVVDVAGQPLVGQPAPTSGWADFRVLDLGPIEIKQAGEQDITVRSRDAQSWKAINLRCVKLVRKK